MKKVAKDNGGSGRRLKNNVVKKKVGGVLRHLVLTLKKVARLSSKDSRYFLQIGPEEIINKPKSH